jgi:hypothetical protein
MEGAARKSAEVREMKAGQKNDAVPKAISREIVAVVLMHRDARMTSGWAVGARNVNMRIGGMAERRTDGIAEMRIGVMAELNGDNEGPRHLQISRRQRSHVSTTSRSGQLTFPSELVPVSLLI